MQQQAAQLAQQGIGTFQPFLQSATDLTRQGAMAAQDVGLGGLQEAFGATRAGQDVLQQAAQQAAAQRLIPETYRQAAEQGIRQATALGFGATDIGRQDLARTAQQTQAATQLGQQGLGAAGQVAAEEAARAQGILGGAAQGALTEAGRGATGILGAGQAAAQQARLAQAGLTGAAGQTRADLFGAAGEAARQAR